MTYCEECKDKMWPENPEVGFTDFRTKQYYPPICQSCSNREETRIKSVPEKEWDSAKWDIINQLRAEVKHIHGELHEKKPRRYQKYSL